MVIVAHGRGTHAPGPGETGEVVTAARRRLKVDYELPMGDAYGESVNRFLE